MSSSNNSHLRQRKSGSVQPTSSDDHGDGDDDPKKRPAEDISFQVVSSSTVVHQKDNRGTLFSSFSLQRAVNKFLKAYTVFVGNSLNQDKLMKVIQYSLWMLSRFYTNQKNTVIQQALVKLSFEFSWTRYVTRLLGLPTALQGCIDGSWASPKALGKAMAWSMVFYYPLEHLSFVQWRAPGLASPKFLSGNDRPLPRLAEKASAWSCRFWLAYIVMDIARSMLALQPDRLTKEDALSFPAPNVVRSERLQLVRSALFLAPAIHWSLPHWDTQPWLSETVCNSLMWLESVVCMYQGIRNMPPVELD